MKHRYYRYCLVSVYVGIKSQIKSLAVVFFKCTASEKYSGCVLQFGAKICRAI